MGPRRAFLQHHGLEGIKNSEEHDHGDDAVGGAPGPPHDPEVGDDRRGCAPIADDIEDVLASLVGKVYSGADAGGTRAKVEDLLPYMVDGDGVTNTEGNH